MSSLLPILSRIVIGDQSSDTLSDTSSDLNLLFNTAPIYGINMYVSLNFIFRERVDFCFIWRHVVFSLLRRMHTNCVVNHLIQIRNVVRGA